MTHELVASQRNRGRVIAWGLWDWGSAAFNAVIVTFIFSVYLVEGVGDDLPGPFRAATWLGLSSAAGAVLIAVLAPVLGRRADAGGARKKTLFWLTFAVVLITASLFFVESDWHFLWLGLVLLAAGSVIFELTQVPYFAMLRQVSTPDDVGRVSGFGWAMGYFGGIVLLLICYFGFVAGDGDTRGFLGVPTDNGLNIRLIAPLAAGWFLLFAIPLFLKVPELPATATPDAPKVGIADSYRGVWNDITQMWREDRSTLKFLIASAFFRDGLAGVFAYGAVLAVSVYSIDKDDVILFGVAANVISAVGALLAGRWDDSIGPRSVIVFSLVSMIVCGTVLLFVEGPRMFWIFGLGLCLFVGPAQSASRTYLTRITTPGREGQNFGLYAMTGRAVSFMAPLMFALTIWAGNLILGTDTDRWGIAGIMVVLAIGLLLLLRVPREVEDRARAIVG
ncbi:MFS transporter [Aeromicrobium duanguangcaii]|uniref:MFS transporter n=1 Tax=Aeromicrobium duanguangcaii TaxID=2968086 RepID=UPI002017BE16|nr:MFS transporter [Aeromicrobium duanguangcaii]MCL3837179.1 MFS transporter [Aeromicrobium duanguangcaii]